MKTPLQVSDLARELAGGGGKYIGIEGSLRGVADTMIVEYDEDVLLRQAFQQLSKSK